MEATPPVEASVVMGSDFTSAMERKADRGEDEGGGVWADYMQLLERLLSARGMETHATRHAAVIQHTSLGLSTR